MDDGLLSPPLIYASSQSCGGDARLICPQPRLPYTPFVCMMCIKTKGGDPMGRTNVVLDDELVEECQRLTGIGTRRALIDYALHEVRRRGLQKRLMKLKGVVRWEGDLAAWRETRP